MKNKVIIFDMDGTIIDSSKSIENSINYVRKLIGLAPIDSVYFMKHISASDDELAELFYPKGNLEENHEKFLNHFDEHCLDHSKLFDGLDIAIKELSKSYPLAIATNASDFFAKKMLKYLGVFEYFDVVTGANEHANGKPKPDMLIYILKELNGSADKSFMIGDSLRDKEAASAINMNYLHAQWGYEKIDSIDCGVSTYKELLEKIID